MHLVKLDDLDGLIADRKLYLPAPFFDPIKNGYMTDFQYLAYSPETQTLQIHVEGVSPDLDRLDVRFLLHGIAVTAIFTEIALFVLDDAVFYVIRAFALWTVHIFSAKNKASILIKQYHQIIFRKNF